MPGGNLGPDVIVEVGAGFRGIETLSAGAKGIRAGAGATGAEVDGVARELDGFLPFLPSSARWCTVGGMVANNAAGPRSFRYGSISAWIEALEGYFAWGEPFRVGTGEPIPPVFAELADSLRGDLSISRGDDPRDWPSVRKNSSGYALDRFLRTDDPVQLLVGSEGTLAIVTSADFRFAPLPAARGLVVHRAESAAELQEIALESGALGATACEFFGRRFLEIAERQLDRGLREMARSAFALVILEVTGSVDEVAARVNEIERVGRLKGSPPLTTLDPRAVEDLWEIRHAASRTISEEADRGRISAQFIEDSVVPPAALGRYLEGLDSILRRVGLDAVVFGHAGDANVHVNPLVPVEEPDWPIRVQRALEGVTDLVIDLGGTLSGEHGDGRLRTPLIPRVWSPPLVRAFRRVKETLDPKGILNPGVVVPRAKQNPFAGFRPRRTAYPERE